jgi:hypothetical protein
MANPLSAVLLKLAGRLRFPYLFAVAAVLFVVDLLVPDVIPLVDELLLGALTLLFGAWRKRKALPEGGG